MNYDKRSSDDSLEVAALERIDRTCLAFEAAWKSGQPLEMESVLADFRERERSVLFRELLYLDVHYRRQRGEAPNEHDYSARFPDQVAVTTTVFAKLARNEEAEPMDVTTPLQGASEPGGQESTPEMPQQIGDYIVLRELGRGGFGTVYLAYDEALRCQVALKIPRREHFKTPEQLRMFLEEARTAVQLKHSGIVRIYRAGELSDGTPFVAMEYLEGDSLETKLRAQEFSPEQIAELMVEIAEVVHYAHQRGVVHRDLKPSNIIVDTNGRPCITDFGLAVRWDPTAVDEPSSAPGLAGTIRFIPPEVYAGNSATKPGLDIYALGVILYLALTDRHPFEGQDFSELREQVLAGKPALPQEINPGVPEKLQRICLKALEPRASRYRSADRLADDLRRFLAGRDVLARPVRYDAELRGRLLNHYSEIHSWREENLITVSEMDRLLRPYWFLLQSDSPWPSQTRQYPLETISIRLGGWLVLLSTLVWLHYLPDLSSASRVAAVALPTIALNGVGWAFWRLHSSWNARVFLGTGVLLLPLLVAVLLQEFSVLSVNQGPARELFSIPAWNWQLTNLQFTGAMAVFLVYCAFLLRQFPGKLFVIWWAVGSVVFFTGCLSLCGLKEWISSGNQLALALTCYLLPCAFFAVGSRMLDRWGKRREAAMLYIFFPIPSAVLLTSLAYYGSVQLQLYEGGEFHKNEIINLWWMANSVVYACAAIFSQRSDAGYVRYWSAFFALLVPLSLLVPSNLLMNNDSLGVIAGVMIGGNPLTIYELLTGVAAIVFIVVGTIISRPTLTIPGLLGLAVFVFRFTQHHFQTVPAWPFAIGVIGGAAMLAGVISSALRSNRQAYRAE